VNVVRSGNSGIDRIALVVGWAGVWFRLFLLLPERPWIWAIVAGHRVWSGGDPELGSDPGRVEV
jgi:hypothetical protein